MIASASALHRGDNGTAVKAMQQRLIDLGYLTSGSADGIFGVKTYQALRDFQSKIVLKDVTITGQDGAKLECDGVDEVEE